MKFIRRYSLTPASEFSGSVMTLLSGAAAALTVSYLMQPVLTRLYTPAEFGLFDTFVAILALFVPFASFKFEDAIVLPDRDEDAGHLLYLSIIILLLVTGGMACVLFFIPSIYSRLDSTIGNWMLLLPAALLLIRLSMVGELWSIRKKSFGRISSVNVVRATSTNVVKLATHNSGLSGLFWGYIAGFSLAVLIYARGIMEGLSLSLRHAPVEGIKRVAKRYQNFPRFTLPASVLGSLVGRLPFLLLLFFFTPEIVGYFGRAFAAIMVPLSVVGTAVANVFFVYAAERRNTPLLASSTERVFDRLVLFGLFPVLAIALAGPQLFGIIFGSAWTQAGDFAQIICLWLFLSAIASPLTRLFDVLERQRLEFFVAGILFVLQTGALLIGGSTGSATTALLYLAIAGSIGRIIQLGILFKISGVGIKKSLIPFTKYGIRSLPGLALIVVSLRFGSPTYTFGATLLGGLLYALLSVKDVLAAFKPATETTAETSSDDSEPQALEE